MRKQRRWLAVTFVLTSMVVIASAGAWACTSNAALSDIAPANAPAGSTVTVSGVRFTEAERGVEIRITDAVSGSGRLIAITTGPTFSVQVEIPALAPGRYTVVAYGRESDGSLAGQAARFFEVTAGGPSSGAETDPSRAPAANSGPTTTAVPPEPSGASAGTGGASQVTTTSPVATAGTTEGEVPQEHSPAPQPGDASASRAEGTPASALTEARRGAAPLTVATPAPARPTTISPPRTGSAARDMVATSDAPTVRDTAVAPSTGVGHEAFPGLPSAVMPATFGDYDGPIGRPLWMTTEGGDGPSPSVPHLVIGGTMLGLGLVAMLAGFGVVDGRRQRARTTANR